MRKLRGRSTLPAGLLVAALAALVLAAPAATAAHKPHHAVAKVHKFTAAYKGKVTEKVSGQTVNATALAPGASNLLGKGAISGKVVASTANPPCSPINGPGVIKGTKGLLKVNVLPTSHACAAGADDQDNISLSGTVKVLKGTKAFKKAKGTLHFSGHYDRKTGLFNVKLLGSIKY